MSKVQELYDQAMKLKKKDRVELVTRLWDAVMPEPPGKAISQGEWEREWGEEIAQRIERYERGETKARGAFESIEYLRKKLNERRKK